MENSIQDRPLSAQPETPKKNVPYDKRKLSYATTFTDPKKIYTIRAMEWLTGKLTLLRLIRKFEKTDVKDGKEFFSQALKFMGIDLIVSKENVDRIPATGALIVVANHPHGMVDGMVMAELVSRKRDDFLILTRSLISGVKEISQFMLPVPFPHEDDALNESLRMRKTAMSHLADGGVIILFPAGEVASADSLFGIAIESDWNPFTAKMINRSGATVLPIYFPGQNSRLYLMADRISATIRQGLLLHEVVHALNKAQRPVVGTPIHADEMKHWGADQRGFMAWLRDHTLALKHQ
ncbi:MAG: lysophospholipid acyltransferase family protein [Paracoccaceae bacterium]